MIKIFKKTYSLFRVLFALSLLFILSAVVFINIILSEDGTPEFVKSHILGYFESQGVYCNADKIYLSLSDGVTISNPVIYADDTHSKRLIEAEAFHINTNPIQLLYNPRKINAIDLNNATITVPLKTKYYPRLNNQKISNINIKLDFSRNQASFEKLSMETASIRASIKGDLKNLPSFSDLLNQIKEKGGPDKPFTMKTLGQTLDAAAPKLKPLVDLWFDDLKFKDKINLDLNFSIPFDQPEESTAILNFNLPSTLYRGLVIRGIDGEIEFKKHNCKLTNFEARFDEKEFVKGNLHYNVKDKLVSAKLESVVFPTRFLKLSGVNAPGIMTFMDRIRPTDTPPSLQITLPPTRIGDEFNFEAIADIKNTWYKQIFFNKATGKLLFNSKVLKFIDIKTMVNHSTPGELSGQYFFGNDELFMDVSIVGDPTFIGDFLGPEVKKIYKGIWQRFKWKKDSPPALSCSFKNKQRGESFMLTGQVNFQDFDLHGEEVTSLTGDLVIHLAKKEQYVLFHNLTLLVDDGHLVGKFAYNMPLGKRGLIDYQCKGAIDAKKIFKIVDVAEVNDAIDFLTFSDQSKIECQGQVNLDQGSKSWMLANLDADFVKLNQYDFNDITAHIERSGGYLQVSDIEAKLYKGDCNGIFTYNYNTDQADLTFNVDKLDLAHIPRDKKQAIVGKARIDLQTSLNFATEHADPLLNGRGSITISDADFWQVPLFTKLTKFVSSETGKITKAEAKLRLTNHIIKVKDFETDGSVISLKGDGTVNYSTEDVYFLMKTIPLKDVLWGIPASILEKFVNKIIVFELKGDYDNQEWTPAPGLLK